MHNMRQMKDAAETATYYLSEASVELLAASIKQENFSTDFGMFLSDKWAQVASIRDEILQRLNEGVY
jgi:hypothetical protein